MAYETGTATSANDLFHKLRLFATTNGWTVLKYIKPNIKTVSLAAGVTYAGTYLSDDAGLIVGPEHKVGIDASGYPSFDNLYNGAYIRFELDAAEAVTSFSMKSGNSGGYMPRRFKLQYSDDGTTWNDAVDATSADVTWNGNETKTWATSNSSPHLYWQLMITATNAFVTINKILFYNGSSPSISYTGELYLKGPGLAAQDEIFVNYRLWKNSSRGEYLVQIAGALGFDTALNWFEQPNASNNQVLDDASFMAVWDQSMTYWFTGNGRMIAGVVKVTTVYQNFYGGFILPYCLPGQYTYPLLIAASQVCDYNARPFVYSKVSNGNTGMTWFGKASQSMASTHSLFMPGGSWMRFGDGATFPINISSTLSIAKTLNGRYVGYAAVMANFEVTNGTFYGELDKIKWIPGEGQSTENTGLINGVNHVIFQVTNNTGSNYYFAMEAQ